MYFLNDVITAEFARKKGSKDKKPRLKDPKGGLTAAGRKAFGGNLKPGVKTKGKDMSPQDWKRKGSWAVRFYKNPRGPMVKPNGEPTRLALSANAWNEPVPKTREAAQRIAAKGERLLEKYRRYKERNK